MRISIPLAFALILTFLLTPVVALLQRMHIGRAVAALATVLVSIAAAGGIGWVLANQLLPLYGQNIRARIEALHTPVTGQLGQAAKSVKEIVQEVTTTPGAPSPDVAPPTPDRATSFASRRLPPYAFAPARAMYKKIRGRFPKLEVVVCLWGFTGDIQTAKAHFERTQPDRLSTSLAEAIEHVQELVHPKSAGQPSRLEPVWKLHNNYRGQGKFLLVLDRPGRREPMSSELMDIAELQKINWTNSLAFGLFHLGALAALFFFSWKALAVAVFLFWMCTGLGISMGYHRLHTHRSYQVPQALEYFFAVCGTLTLEGGPIFWVATHRLHHQKSDQPGDPHSPHDGGWWAHMGWLLLGETKHSDASLFSKYAPDLTKDRFYVWLNNYHWVPIIVLGVLLWAMGGLPFVLWGIFLRVVVGLHCTWLVNSATHMWGSRRFETRDDSRNNWLIALITSGEGWHNNHHAHPTSARHGLAWYEFDLSWIQIKILKSLGIAKSVRVAKINSALAEREAA